MRIAKEEEHCIGIETICKVRIVPHERDVEKVEGKENESTLNDEMNFDKVKQSIKGRISFFLL